MLTYVFILGRVAVGPAADFYKKRLSESRADPLFVVLMTFAFIAAVSCPALFVVHLPGAGSAFWMNMVAASLFDTTGMVFVMMAIGVTELSIYGPLNAYKPVITLALGAAFLREIPSWIGIVGVVVIVAGSAILHYEPSQKKISLGESIRNKGVWYRLLSIVLFCIGVIYLKRAVLESSPFLVLFFWALFGLALCVITTLVFRAKTILENFTVLLRDPFDFAAVCISMLFVQALTLLSFGIMFVGYAIALFQLASLPDVVLGNKFFGEKNTTFRFVGASVMIVGALLIVLLI
jgi:drug/metabolite transporter (DMT)-like permease